MSNLTKIINQNFLIRTTCNETKQTHLIGVSTFKALFKTDKKAEQFLNKALDSNKQIFTIRLRRGLKIDFISR